MQLRLGCGASRRMGWLVAALLLVFGAPARADTGQLVVSAVVLSKSNCKFRSSATALNFGTIDPSSGSQATASTTVQIKCAGSASSATYSIQAGDGLYSTGPGLRRVRNTTTTTEFMPYTLSLSPASATIPKNAAQTITVSGTIAPADFQNAAVGGYSDTVVLTLNP